MSETQIEIEFPSIFDANPESALFFLENGFPESAKRVIKNLANELKQNELSVTRDDSSAAFLIESAKAFLIRNGEMAVEIDRLESENYELRKELKSKARFSQSRSNLDWETIRFLEEENAVLSWRVTRMEKTIRGLNKGYGKLKRAFNSHAKKISLQIEENSQLAKRNAELEKENQFLGTENAELHNKNARRVIEEIETLLNPS